MYRQYVGRIYAFLLARVGNDEDARDLTSQTFLAAWEGIEQFRGRSRLSTWVFRIARNKCADHFRRGKVRPLPLDDAADAQAPTVPPHELVEQLLQLQDLLRHMHLLSEDQAEALSLRIFAGLSPAEVGQIMDKSPMAVKMLVHRAVGTLRKRMAPWKESGE
jgi:RNA polymerase sigma-70 factor (ECF subfamily)